MKLRPVRFWRERTTHPPNRWKPPSEGRSPKLTKEINIKSQNHGSYGISQNVPVESIYYKATPITTCPAISLLFYTTKFQSKWQSFVLKIQASPCLPLVYINPKVEFPCKSLGVFSGWLNHPKKTSFFGLKLSKTPNLLEHFALFFFSTNGHFSDVFQ